MLRGSKRMVLSIITRLKHQHIVKTLFTVLSDYAYDTGYERRDCYFQTGKMQFVPHVNVLELDHELKKMIETGHLNDARRMFDKLPQRDEISWTTIISKRLLHGYSVKTGFVNSVFVGSTLLDMYAKCGCISLGYCVGTLVFSEMPGRNVISWTAIISALGRVGHNKESIRYFVEMWKSDVECDSYTFASAVKACADSNRQKWGLILLLHMLIVMYNNRWKLEYGLCLFGRMRTRDVVSWTTTISTYIQLGREETPIQTFLQMRESDISPNEFTFAALSRSSLAEQVLRKLNGRTVKQDDVVWSTLLRTCMVLRDVERAKRIVRLSFEIDSNCAGTHITFCNILAINGQQKEAASVRKSMKSKGVVKEPAWSMVRVKKDHFSTFVAGDRSHSQGEKIYSMLDLMRAVSRLEEITDNSITFEEMGS
ncbi:hypothetical protein MKW92_018764 [Papaver armeniacum]|nr:hypothetical protein MKW92_018764 [Papaver armeniacum]